MSLKGCEGSCSSYSTQEECHSFLSALAVVDCLKILIMVIVHDPHHLSPLSKDTHAERPRESEVDLPLFCSSIRASS